MRLLVQLAARPKQRVLPRRSIMKSISIFQTIVVCITRVDGEIDAAQSEAIVKWTN
ncbi:hypothetical protein N181_24625 [Sinorhizobium fredii USDA 205]|nr:hypothetical protein N181_24625 [Sinorhizobium fredii USDA 205]